LRLDHEKAEAVNAPGEPANNPQFAVGFSAESTTKVETVTLAGHIFHAKHDSIFLLFHFPDK